VPALTPDSNGEGNEASSTVVIIVTVLLAAVVCIVGILFVLKQRGAHQPKTNASPASKQTVEMTINPMFTGQPIASSGNPDANDTPLSGSESDSGASAPLTTLDTELYVAAVVKGTRPCASPRMASTAASDLTVSTEAHYSRFLSSASEPEAHYATVDLTSDDMYRVFGMITPGTTA
jgi:hypothetical protein